jgi:AcrR family transcriptional regulator
MEEATETDTGTVLRRAPFSDNPRVGVRGQRTQQRILDAALRVFGDVGYHQCSIDSITKLAGCSRVSFYQYFESKEDVFRHLAVQVARQLNASTDLLDPVTPDLAGWETMRAWVGRYADIYARYEPVFNAFPAAAESDETLIGDSVRTAHRYLSGIRTRVTKTDVPPRDLDEVIDLLRACLGRTLDDVSILHNAAPDAFPLAVILDAFTDVVHRSLFGLNPAVNVHRARVRRSPKVPFGPVMTSAFDEDLERTDAVTGGPARIALLAAGREVFVTRGFHGTRVDDVVDAAGVSHGAFYRYFKNKDELAHLLAAQAMRTVSKSFLEIPSMTSDVGADRTALRRWLRTYNQAQVNEAAMIRVWVDAALQDDALLADSASVLDWGRRRMAHYLHPRDFGDPDTDAVVLLALVDTFGVREASARAVEAAAAIIERGFLGRVL